MASSTLASAPAEPVEAPARGGRARRTRALVLAGGGFVLLLVTVAAAAPLIAPHDPVRHSLRGRPAAPTLPGGAAKAHPFRTDPLGRDRPSRVLSGAGGPLMVVFAAVLVVGVVGPAL